MEYYKIKNYRVISVKYIGPTNYRGARIKIFEENREGQILSRIFSYDYGIGDIGAQAYKILSENGFNIVCKASLFKTDVFLCDNWGNNFIELKDIKE